MGNESCLIIDLFKNPAFTAIASSVLTCIINYYFQRHQLDTKWNYDEKSKKETRSYNLKVEAYKELLGTLNEFSIRQLTVSEFKEKTSQETIIQAQSMQFKFNKASAFVQLIANEDVKSTLVKLKAEINKNPFKSDIDSRKVFTLENILLEKIKSDVNDCNK